MLRALYDKTLEWSAHRHATWILALVAFTESSFFLIPPDVLLIPMVLAARTRWFRLALICTIASVLGGVFGYFIGAFLFEEIGQPILEFYHAADKFANHDLRRQRHQILTNITAARFEVVMEAVLLKSCDDAYKRGMAKPGRGRVGDWKPFGPDATLQCIELEEKDTHPYGKFVYILERRGGGPGGNHTGARRRHHVARAE